MTDERALLPCPFCGATPDASKEYTFGTDQGGKWGYVVCCCTGPEVRTGYGPVENWKADAITEWNTRHEAAKQDASPPEGLAKNLEHWAHVLDGREDAWTFDDLTDLLRQASQAIRGVPEGWRLVPVEPTAPMIRAGIDAYYGATDRTWGKIWQDMLAAAPRQARSVP